MKQLHILGCLLVVGSLFAADPAFYKKQATWQETLRVSREALAASTTNAAPLWSLSKTCMDVPGSKRPMFQTKVKLNVSGVQELCIGTMSMPSGKGTMVEWQSAWLFDKAGKKTALLKVPVTRCLPREDTNSINPEKGQMKLNHIEAQFALNGQFERLEAGVSARLTDGGAVMWADAQSWFAEQTRLYNGKRQILALIERDFPSAELKEQRRLEGRDFIWLNDWKAGDVSELIARYAAACKTKLKKQVADATDLEKACRLYTADVQCSEMLSRLALVSGEAMQRAVADLRKTFGEKYPKGAEFAARVGKMVAELPRIRERLECGDVAAVKDGDVILTFQKEALLSNPLLDFGKLLFVRRDGQDNLGLGSNFGPNTNPGGSSEIAVLSPVAADGKVSTLFRDPKNKGVVDVDLDFDASRMLFTMTDANGIPQLWEIKADGSGLRQLTPGEESAEAKANPVHNCNGCYLPDGRIIFVSTATMVGVPCVGGSIPVGNLYRLEADGKTVTQLTFDQDQNWYPRLLANGRVMYTRWEYTDTAHYFTRLLFTMNPDGTSQMELYGSNSYWPNSTFFTRPIPDHPSKLVGVVTGHHGSQRAGELVLFDPAQGRRETSGVVQRIPGYGQKVAPTIEDHLVDDSWPKFLYPYPLSDKYFLVSCKLTPDAPWGIYLADIFDNLVPLRVEAGAALMEPIPFRPTTRPPAVPDRMDPKRKDAVVYLQDVYAGPGLAGIPRGAVKKLRVLSYAYNYRAMGSHSLVGQESGWDVKRILGTVPVEPDGSAMFRVPANTPIALQPIDNEGRALQLMRSWMTARPGETLSCVGCHETMNSAPTPKRNTSSEQTPDEIKPWYGPTRGFSFEREVQPVLDKFCVGCHNGQKRPDGKAIPDFASRKLRPEPHSAGTFSESYLALNQYVRRPGPESDYHMFFPMEWHADTSELVQMLKKGHHGVKLDTEAWDRLYTWIDLNVPFYGTYRETVGRANAWNPRSEAAAARHRELMKRYANMDVDLEAIPDTPKQTVTPIVPAVMQAKLEKPPVSGWPFDEKQAKALQAAAGKEAKRTVTLGDGVTLSLVLIPAGEFVMGDAAGYPDEQSLSRVKIERPFWMAELEVSNRLFAQFDPLHDSRYQDAPGKDQNVRGYPANKPDQPVVRITWQQAMDFCQWLSAKTSKRFTLPTEAQWEWACRAGTEIAPASLIGRTGNRWGAASNVGESAPNAWGLKDMYSNVSEWTLSAGDEKFARGGSWFDSAKRARAGLRVAYLPYQRVFNVGFRVIMEDDAQLAKNDIASGGVSR